MQFPLALAIIEDQASIRDTLHEYLCAQPEFRCVLIADSVEAFLRGLPTAAAPPQLVLSDIGLPGLTGIEGLPLIQQLLPEAQVLMLSVYADAERVFEALRAGAVGYLLKNTPLAQLKEHLLQVAAGGSPMSPGVARFVVQAFQRQPAVAAPATMVLERLLPEPLTARELEVVRGIEDGLSYQLIAERHFISLDTVRNHIRSVYRKLQVNSRGELLAQALKRRRD
ncbi:response regulator transcription factor [Hymenobacter sp. DH14]|uniref:Response regulator transcription factor n=1 Tax=Hymenobacter cyanobacteriorum TaxID=2926463 RepID=A0A9X2AI33_9BACT|nr:response regulator transcription factor [Hymenobacter cyanobacteriorum]MCI1187239.1 response regulator transcription factor [Hymenobacter cyanobacteriorum]